MSLQERLLHSGLFLGARVAFGCQLAAGVPCIRRSAVDAQQQLRATEAAAAAVKAGRDIEIGHGDESLGPHRQILYAVIRVSQTFAVQMVMALSQPNHAIGHHEVITDPFCLRHGLHVANLPASTLRGTFTPGGWGPFIERRIEKRIERHKLSATVSATVRHNATTVADRLEAMKVDTLASLGHSRHLQSSPWVQRDALYHPTKCEADPRLGQRQLDYI